MTTFKSYAEAKVVAEYEISTPNHGEWWMVSRGGVKTVLLFLEDSWFGDEIDTYEYQDVTPLFKMKICGK
ncbi:hypothetical protein NVP1161O_201 [Vibrio phage 1.161.O._10N.261.48.C5]|nr:hypothetical protein NVP1161O_201 [Vibrio phage 1.161.O._10N.261.48.C5]